ncbi:septum formation initiator family protein [Azotosporobacter soli]|uniref:FtsB family cell division protein n=1 Tax=Azotosporobacter soli TaxID=3055040 RepID=UPI0031FEF1D5
MKQRRKRFSWFRLLCVLLLGYSLYLCVEQQMQLSAIRSERDATQAKLQQLQQSNADLKEEAELLQQPKYVEKLAREQLGLTKPGEVLFMQGEKQQ